MIDKFMREICPYRIGQRVRIKPDTRFATDWTGVYAVVGLVWKYTGEVGHVDVWLASDDDIRRGVGPTDGWSLGELEPVP